MTTTGMSGATGIAALTEQVAELSRALARLSELNAELGERVSALAASAPAGRRATRRGAAPDASGQAGAGTEAGSGAVSRRSVGKALGVAAAGVVGAAVLAEAAAQPAAANTGDPVIAGASTSTESMTEIIFDGPSFPGPGVIFEVDEAGGVTEGGHSAAILGSASVTVQNGVYGFTFKDGGSGVLGVAGLRPPSTGLTGAAGVRGIAYGPDLTVGVLAENSTGLALRATGAVGVLAEGTGAGGYGVHATGSSGVFGAGDIAGVEALGGTYGVHATGGTSGVHGSGGTGVEGDGGSSGTGVAGSGQTGVSASGSSTGVSASGPVAVLGSGSGGGGRGGVFSSAAAQVQLVPGSLSSHPTSGTTGDLYVDTTGRLWFCRTGGPTAIWRDLARDRLGEALDGLLPGVREPLVMPHVPDGLGTAAAENGYRVRYVTAALVNELVEAADDNDPVPHHRPLRPRRPARPSRAGLPHATRAAPGVSRDTAPPGCPFLISLQQAPRTGGGS